MVAMVDGAKGPPADPLCGVAVGPLLSLLRLVSPGLPVGGYSYSRGLEYAVESRVVHDEASASDWIGAYVERVGAGTDAPLLRLIYDALSRNERAAVTRLEQTVQALRESAELRMEDHHMGLALARLLADLGSERASALVGHPDCSFVSLFALAALEQQIPVAAAVAGYLWLLAESQVSAAIRLIPLGQTAGQRILQSLLANLPAWTAAALARREEEVGSYLPGMAIASALHETQYARLFRS